MRKFTSIGITIIICFYIIFSGLYVLTKDYTGEKAEVSTFMYNDDPNTVMVYVPDYMMHLEIPRKEWPRKDEVILQKDYELHEGIICIIVSFMVISGVLIFVLIAYLISFNNAILYE